MRAEDCEVRIAGEYDLGDGDLQHLLQAVYVQEGYTDPILAAALFEPSAVRARGEILIVQNKGTTSPLGMVIVVAPTSGARRLAAPDEAEMHLLATLPQERRRGLGAMLVNAATDRARSLGYRRMVLWTQPIMHAAQRLYERQGFTRAPDRDWQRDDRRFLVYEKTF